MSDADTIPLYERSLIGIPKEERKVLLSIRRPEDVKTCKVLNTWTDDHIDCVGVELNGVEVGFWWVGPEMCGAFKYWDSATAKVDIVNMIAESVNTADQQCEGEDDLNEGEGYLTLEEMALWKSGKV